MRAMQTAAKGHPEEKFEYPILWPIYIFNLSFNEMIKSRGQTCPQIYIQQLDKKGEFAVFFF